MSNPNAESSIDPYCSRSVLVPAVFKLPAAFAVPVPSFICVRSYFSLRWSASSSVFSFLYLEWTRAATTHTPINTHPLRTKLMMRAGEMCFPVGTYLGSAIYFFVIMWCKKLDKKLDETHRGKYIYTHFKCISLCEE